MQRGKKGAIDIISHFPITISETLSPLFNREKVADILHAFALIDESGIRKSLTEIVSEHLHRNVSISETSPVTVGELFENRLALYDPSQIRSATALASARRYFCAKLGEMTLVETLDTRKIETALAEKTNPVTWNGLLRRFRLALNWAVKKGTIKASALQKLEFRSEPWREPVYFSPDKVERVMRLAELHPGTAGGAIGARLAMGFFAGVRTAEVLRARWADFDAESAILRIPRPKGWTRGAKPRIIELESNAVEWLARWRNWNAEHRADRQYCDLIVREPWRLQEWKRQWLKPTGLSWGCRNSADISIGNVQAENVMRHTYATMHVGAFRNAAATAVNLGHCNGTALLEKHYRGLVSRKAAEGYWRIMPGTTMLPPPEEPPGQGRRTDLYSRNRR